MDTIIEIHNRSGKLIERMKFSQAIVTIGRAYTNDMILSETHVCPQHVKICRTSSGWIVKDLASINGVMIDNKPLHGGQKIIQSGGEIVLGKFRIRVFDECHPVPQAVKLGSTEAFFSFLGSLRAITLFSGCLLLYIFYQTQGYLQEGSLLMRLINYTISYFLIAVIWSAAWSLVGRVARHDPRFVSQLSVSICILLVALIMADALDMLEFNLQNGSLIRFFEFVIMGGLLCALIWANLYLSTNYLFHLRTNLSLLAGVLFVGLNMLFDVLETPYFSRSPEYSSVLKPASYYFGQPEEVEHFIASSETIFAPSSRANKKAN